MGDGGQGSARAAGGMPAEGIACMTSDPPLKTAAATTALDAVRVTESTGRTRAPRRETLHTNRRRAGRPEQTHAASADGSLTA
jgi:hypothetical protein